ncbi:MAG: NAD(P)-binding domain-containing protein [Pseudoclavibacter sp.]
MNTTQGDRPTVGFIGLGTMGDPMSTNIATGGYDVRLYDLDVDRARALADRIGAAAAADVAELAECGVVVLMLPTSAIVRQALLDDAGAPLDATGGRPVFRDLGEGARTESDENDQ